MADDGTEVRDRGDSLAGETRPSEGGPVPFSTPRRGIRRSQIGIMAAREATLRSTIARQEEQIARLKWRLAQHAVHAKLLRHHRRMFLHARRIEITLFPTRQPPQPNTAASLTTSNTDGAPMTYWNDDRTAYLRTLWADGYSCSQIAGKLGGTTRNAVISKVHRLDLPQRIKLPRKTSRRAISSRPRRPRASDRALPNPHYQSQIANWPPLPLPEESPTPPVTVTLTELGPTSCRYPFGDNITAPIKFCGCPQAPGSSYCPAHHAHCSDRPRRSAPATDQPPVEALPPPARRLLLAARDR